MEARLSVCYIKKGKNVKTTSPQITGLLVLYQ